VAAHGDIVLVPGLDTYRNLPSKTLRLLHLGLAHACVFTHVMKVDDDCYVRPAELLRLVMQPPPHAAAAAAAAAGSAQLIPGSHIQQHASTRSKAATAASSTAGPWMSGLYVGQLAGKDHHAARGFKPIRDPASKWYLSQQELPDEVAPLGTPYAVGWSYLMSRDVALLVLQQAALYEADDGGASSASAGGEGRRARYGIGSGATGAGSGSNTSRPAWWGRLPWEDVVVGALLRGAVALYDHPGFMAPYMSCPDDMLVRGQSWQARTAGCA
jgi:hypothetical protein